MDTLLQISVVVATYNRSDILTITLERLADQTLDPSLYEVIVVDDGSSDNTRAMILQIQTKLPYHLTYLHHENHGISYTQNRGIRAASAPLVCLIADDIHFSPNALKEHIKDHTENSEEHIAILGKVQQSPELAQTTFLKTWDPFRYSELEKLRELPYYLFFACNISLKKNFLLKKGLFCENLVKEGAYAHEDVELGFRLYQNGLKILYNKNALAYHYHLVTLDQAIKTAYNKGLAWVPFRNYVNKPEMTVRYHVLQSSYLRDYLIVLRKNNNLIGLDSKPFSLLISQLIRVLMFNVITVPLLWLPLMELAEKYGFFSALMHKLHYRCTISHHFHKGVAVAKKRCE